MNFAPTFNNNFTFHTPGTTIVPTAVPEENSLIQTCVAENDDVICIFADLIIQGVFIYI